MHGELLGTQTTPQTVVTVEQPAMLAMPGVMGIVPDGHVPVHVFGGVGGRGGGFGMKPPTCIGGSCCCWFWVCVNCCVVGGGDIDDWVGGGVVCICLMICSVDFLTMYPAMYKPPITPAIEAPATPPIISHFLFTIEIT